MSIAALLPVARLGGAALIKGGMKLFGRKGRKRARMAGPAAAPSILERAAALTGRLAARPGAMVGVPRRRRARGISGTEIRGFKKVARLLATFGMRPRGLARPAARGRRPFSRARFGDPDDGGGFEE